MTTLKKASFPVAKNEAGDPQLICLVNGKVPTTSQDPGTCYHARGKEDLTETATVPDQVTIGEVTINVSKVYACLEYASSSNVDTIWTACYVDDADGTPTETIIHEWLTGPGQPSVCCKLDCAEFDTTGGTGTQKLRIKATAVSADCLGCAIGYVAMREQA